MIWVGDKALPLAERGVFFARGVPLGCSEFIEADLFAVLPRPRGLLDNLFALLRAEVPTKPENRFVP